MIEKEIKIALILCFTALIGLFLYLTYQTNRITDKNYHEELVRTQQANKLQDCMDTAYYSYNTNWELRVKNWGSKDRTLPAFLAEPLETKLREDKELCGKLY